MTVSELIERAKSACGRRIRYQLGAGGIDPKATTPANHSGECDCSGFTAWALGISRKTDHPLYVRFNGGWINTDALCRDAATTVGLFEPVIPMTGSLVVFPKQGRGGYGHVGVVTKIDGGKLLRVIHCSAGNWKKYGDAIRETGPEAFLGKTGLVYAWYSGLEVG